MTRREERLKIKRRRKIILIAVIAVIVLLLLVGGFILLKKHDFSLSSLFKKDDASRNIENEEEQETAESVIPTRPDITSDPTKEGIEYWKEQFPHDLLLQFVIDVESDRQVYYYSGNGCEHSIIKWLATPFNWNNWHVKDNLIVDDSEEHYIPLDMMEIFDGGMCENCTIITKKFGEEEPEEELHEDIGLEEVPVEDMEENIPEEQYTEEPVIESEPVTEESINDVIPEEPIIENEPVVDELVNDVVPEE